MRKVTHKPFFGIVKILSTVVAATVLSVATGIFAFADDEAGKGGYLYDQNPETQYYWFVDDEAGLYTYEDAQALMDVLQPLTENGNAGIVTIDYNYKGNCEAYAENFIWENFGRTENTIVFLIDMDTRNLVVSSEGKYFNSVSTSVFDTITDNVYRYASDGDYLGCAKEAVSEIITVYAGGRIAQPMKYISNAILALILSLVITYFIARGTSSTSKATTRETLKSIFSQHKFGNAQKTLTGTTKEYSPRSSGSGGSHGGGGGGGGGGHSGSHGF